VSDGDYSNFYRAMHFTAKRGIAIACRLSVSLSVTLEKFQVAISPQPVVRSTSCLVTLWGFRGRQI